jgi:alpha-N-acetylglucosaminidase
VYYLNFCTFGYTTAWWGWTEWEQEIDWMALHGVTTPLMAVGHEAVIERVLRDHGMHPKIVEEFLSGPAYLPWFFMGCLEGFPGPLPAGWIDAHRGLGGLILKRQRELGMSPVLPAFTGHLPLAMADGLTERDWQGHRTHFLDPDDPLFRRITADIVGVQQEFWGTDHRYASDPFIEIVPGTDDPDYPGRVARAILDGLHDADPKALWYLQTWPFAYQSDFWSRARVDRFLSALPRGRVVLLDLWAEAAPQWRRFSGFSGQPWYWCALLNFGGRNDPIGNLTGVADQITDAFRSAHPPSGIGLSMEATRTTPVYFERVLDPARDNTPLHDWLSGWVNQRYRLSDQYRSGLAVRAWQGLADTVLDSGDYLIFPETFNGLVNRRPSADLTDNIVRLRDGIAGLLWYEPSTLTDAWRALIELAEMTPEMVAGPLGRDLVEIAHAVLPRYAELCFLVAFDPKGPGGPANAQRYFQVLDDIDELLATRAEFRYTSWERAALAWARDPEGERILRDNARRLVTVWGRVGDETLDDYSARLWSGLMRYYRGRWQIWDEWRNDPVALEARLRDHEERFLKEGTADTSPSADTVSCSRRLFARYAEPFQHAVHAFRTAYENADGG